MRRIPPILRSTAFRTAAVFASALTVCVVLLFAFIYWQTALSETARIDGVITRRARMVAGAPPAQILWLVQNRAAADLHRITFAALFDGDGRLIAGNLQRIPDGLAPDDKTHWVDAVAVDAGQSHPERVIAIAERLADGRLLVMGRNIEELSNLRRLVARALVLGGFPAVLLALGVGAWVGQRTWRRVRSWQHILNRVRGGDLSQRLPTRDGGGDVDQLAEGVNHMLDELERLLGELHNVGNNIAHDLRTPLARVRAQLERARRGTQTREDLERTIDRTIAGLDQSISITTSLLRIAEIEGSRRRDAFGLVDLVEIAKEVAEFYEPAAEQKRIALRLDLQRCADLYGDRDLLSEAVANLVDNAIKFTPNGGRVELRVGDGADGPQLRVSDDGPGIPAAARDDVFKRFFRFDRSRNAPGIGLGLSLVAAIVKLHGYALAVEDGRPGFVVTMKCTPGTARDASHPARRQLAAVTP
jgi:signal transduction histidine kinase